LFSTHVILTSGACWGGSEQRLLTPDPADPADPRMSSKSRILYVFSQQKLLGPHSGAMFFLPAIPASADRSEEKMYKCEGKIE
jgi:hypothetical protein